MNALEKEMGQTIYEAGAPYKPGEPGRSAYCAYVPAGTKRVPNPALDEILREVVRETLTHGMFVQRGGGLDGGAMGHFVGPEIPTVHDLSPEQVILKQVCYPARPPIPPQPARAGSVIKQFNLGWNAGARSIESVEGESISASFSAKVTIMGGIVGFAGAGDNAIGLPEIRYGIEVSRGKAYVVVDGRRIHELGAYTNSDYFFIERTNGTAYFIVGELLTSPTASYSMPDPGTPSTVWLGAWLYSGKDTIDEPELDATSRMAGRGAGVVELLPIDGIGAEGGYAFGVGDLAPLQTLGQAANVGYGSPGIAPLLAIGANHRVSFGSGALHPLDGYGVSGIASMGYGLGIGYLPPADVVGFGLTGGVGSAELMFSEIDGLAADRPYAAGSGILRPLVTTGYSGEGPSRASLLTVGLGLDTQATTLAVLVALDASASQSGQFGVSLITIAQMSATAQQSDQFALSQELAALLVESARQNFSQGVLLIDAASGDLIDLSQAWAVNSESGASTQYTNFGFTSFARVGDRLLGAKHDGVYELGGGTDDGSAIQSVVALGQKDFGTSALKHIPAVYVGVSSTNKLVLRVATPQGNWYYTARASGSALRQQRFDLGRGLRANYYEFELYNQDGSDFELESIEFLPVATSRRI